MAETLNIISIVLFVLGCVFFVLAVVYFFKYKIHNVINILSGRNAKKAIAKMNGTKVTKNNVAKKQKIEMATEILENNKSVDCGVTEILENNENVDCEVTEILGDMPTEILQ